MKNTKISNDVLSKEYLNNIIPSKILDSPIESISTGNIILDREIGCGGIPKARITEIFGNESCGKTTLTLQVAKECTRQKKKVLYIDLEYALDINYAKDIGIDTDYFFVAHARSGEIAFGMIENALINQSFDLIVVDSVAAMVPEDEAEGKIEEISSLGSHARLMSRGIRKIQTSLATSNTALIFINQIREKIGVMFGNPETTTGGKALKYYASLRMEIKKAELIKNGQDRIGIKSKITIVKNKISRPFGQAFISIYFGEGFNYINDLLEYAISIGLVKKSGCWFSYNNENISQGIEQLRVYAKNHPEWLEELKKNCLASINPSITNSSNIISY